MCKPILIATFLLTVSGCPAGGDDMAGDDVAGDPCAPECSADCSGGSFTIPCESGPVSYSESCEYSYGPNGDVTRIDCDGTATYQNSGNSYDYTVVWSGASCSIEVDVEGHGTCEAS